MISFSKIMRKVITERISFKTLLGISEPDRVDRSRHVSSKSLRVITIDGDEAWTFSYKSQGYHSTTGKRWHGYVRFFKEDVSTKESAEDLDCKVYCDCPDYVFRYAYNNHKEDAGDLGANNGQPPKSRAQGGVRDYGVGLCKHLISLGKFLKTNIDAPEPSDELPEPKIVKPAPKITPSTPQTTQAPEPEDSYTDGREDDSGYSDSRGGLEEGLSSRISNLFKKFQEFVKKNHEFEVPYE